MTGASALSAGFALILVTLVLAAAGAGVGSLLGNVVAGGFVGGIAGICAGFAVVWRVYAKPMRDASLSRDYSHLKTHWDTDD